MGLGYRYVESEKWWLLGVALALAIAVAVGGFWLVQEIGCTGLGAGDPSGYRPPPCTEYEQDANERNLQNNLLIALPALTIFNVLNAWRLAWQGNKKIQKNAD